MPKVITAIAFVSLLLPSFVRADGMVISPPNYWMDETGQRAAIVYENKTETLVISTAFQGNAKDFGWLVPTPSMPTISKGSQELFTNLQHLTQYTEPQPLGLQIDNVGGLAPKDTGVTIVNQQQVDYYDVTTLTATDKDALQKWLTDNKYNLPDASSYLLNEYIANKWYFVAMRVNTDSLSTGITDQLRSGQATPVVLSFQTDNLVYPLKISSALKATPGTTITDDLGQTRTLVSGKYGKALSLATGEMVAYNTGTSFPYQNGTFTANVQLSPWQSGGYRQIATVKDTNGNRVMYVRLAKDYSTAKEYLQFIWYMDNAAGFYGWSAPANITDNAWHNIAVTWSNDVHPQIYVDGTSVVTTSSTGTGWIGTKAGAGSTLTIGGNPDASADSLVGAVDDVSIWSASRSADQITTLSTSALTKAMNGAYPVDLAFTAPYDTNVALYDQQGNEMQQMRTTAVMPMLPLDSSASTSFTYPTMQNRYQQVTLYVFTNERKDANAFTTNYANWIPRKTIQDLAFSSTGGPLLNVQAKKLYLTVLTRSLDTQANLDDVFFRRASDQTPIGIAPVTNDVGISAFWIFVGSACFVSLALVTILLMSMRRNTRAPQPPMAPPPIVPPPPPPTI